MTYADISNTEKDIAPIKLKLIKLGPGHYTTNNLTIPFSGTWTVNVRALVTDSGVGFDINDIDDAKLGFTESVVARLRDVGGNARLLIFGGLLALVVLFLPQGIIPTGASWIERWRTRGKAGLAGERLSGIDLRERSAPAPPVPTASNAEP